MRAACHRGSQPLSRLCYADRTYVALVSRLAQGVQASRLEARTLVAESSGCLGLRGEREDREP